MPVKISDRAMDNIAREISAALPIVPEFDVERREQEIDIQNIFRHSGIMLMKSQELEARLEKFNREIGISCSRITLLFHIMDPSENTVPEAEELIVKLINGPIKGIGLELVQYPTRLHHNTVIASFQKYVLARNMLYFMKKKSIMPYSLFTAELEGMIMNFPATAYLLGLADLTGELTRKIIDSLSLRVPRVCSEEKAVFHHLCIGLMGTGGEPKLELKFPEITSNREKVEQAVYDVNIYGYVKTRELEPDWDETTQEPQSDWDDTTREPHTDWDETMDGSYYAEDERYSFEY